MSENILMKYGTKLSRFQIIKSVGILRFHKNSSGLYEILKELWMPLLTLKRYFLPYRG